ncbi:DUF2442 domain-containing protein (plasmid) [Komagataeibacter oboediens]|uniref:DUF2442 domain-containing protein n=1 Tax=Komagataeibacter oboediens TaxID=65958 RepID=UPI0023DBDC6D|nr:DUF2442 domain-containing protein [Komagataeibacter oboediens]WEQ54167.1 DUF2442 domain-containing protein [Komagataeibacter oboediens]
MRNDHNIEKQMDAAYERGRIRRETVPQAIAAGCDATTGRVTVELSNGTRFEFPASQAQGLERATPEQLAQVEIMGGYGLHWEALDADLLVPELMAGLFGSRAYMAAKAGRQASPAKAAAARRNGVKGGRPRKVA